MSSVSRHEFSPHLTLCAVGAMLILVADQALSPAPQTVPEPSVTEEIVTQAAPSKLDATEQALSQYVSRRFLIASEAASRMVSAANRVARQLGLDPFLVLAVISVESRFNPIAESVMGAKGLMQIIPKYHRDKLDELGGEGAVLDPETNIEVGARILQEYVYRTGSLEAGLQLYNGAFNDASAQYAQKVFSERSRILTALEGKN
jgi:soluble lytic murein transglycosylase-like protein